MALLKSGNADDAIASFERSLSVDPSSNQNYYYLAEAWLMKGNVEQAREFNQLADMYLKPHREWTARVADQHERINKLTEAGK
jgi:tetratricopeptide (TPR) repeat protein